MIINGPSQQAGLCLSRAAAMVINFNLLLVWLPMCKYSLTRLAYLGNRSLKILKEKQNQLTSPKVLKLPTTNSDSNYQIINITNSINSSLNITSHNNNNNSTKLEKKFKLTLNEAILRANIWLLKIKINSINSFLIAVDNCKSLHTICATTITIASVIHTVAHLINVINFSNNFEPLLSNLNMAEYKGQNPFHLLISVPGITGCLMIVILLLMSLSSVDIIRNSSYDLFQIFHRLSIVFVLLLFLHPSSHVLKEQSNVSRHHPDICLLNNLTNIIISPLPTTTTRTLNLANNSIEASNNITINKPKTNNAQKALSSNVTLAQDSLVRHNSIVIKENRTPLFNSNSTNSKDKNYFIENSINSTIKNQINSKINDLNNPERIELKSTTDKDKNSTTRSRTSRNVNLNESNDDSISDSKASSISDFATFFSNSQGVLLLNNNNNNVSIQGVLLNGEERTKTIGNNINVKDFCLDPLPLFVAQSSICWYVLSIGLSCYLTDLLLRRKRRSKSSIELLNVRLDREGNLVELILNNNHKRFAYWLPGQFVYLNCPQIAQYEWHPFTISSMDNKNKQFTLHIKTGGDWTRKLRETLECKLISNNSMSSTIPPTILTMNKGSTTTTTTDNNKFRSNNSISFNSSNNNLAKNLSIFLDNQKFSGFKINTHNKNEASLPQIECTKLVRIQYENECPTLTNGNYYHNCDCVKIELDNKIINQDHIQGPDFCNSTLTNVRKQDVAMTNDNRTCCCCCNCCCYSPEANSLKSIDLFIDGPFHSPFERLLEQEISICIANGVGWTAFSSVFHCIINNTISNRNISRLSKDKQKDWWHKWSNFAVRPSSTVMTSDLQNKQPTHGWGSCDITSTSTTQENIQKINNNYFPHTKLHLIVIVTSIEQLKPFYYLTVDYFKRILQQDINGMNFNRNQVLYDNPVREITAYITRECKSEPSVLEFCKEENLNAFDEFNLIKVNDIFTLKFGKPNLEFYLKSFSDTYSNSSKLSVYCCGSYHVKKNVQEICKNLNKMAKNTIREKKFPIFSYHEENF